MVSAIRHSFATYFRHASIHFAENAKELEAAFVKQRPKTTGFMVLDHASFVVASIISSATFLEAVINEFFKDIEDMVNSGNYYKYAELGTETKKSIANFSNGNALYNASVLERYNFALFLARKSEFDKGTESWENIRLLFTIRNELIHFKPHWITIAGEKTETDNKITKRLADPIKRKLRDEYTLNPFMSESINPFFPDKCMGYGLAKWASDSSIIFVNEFFARMSIKSPYLASSEIEKNSI